MSLSLTAKQETILHTLGYDDPQSFLTYYPIRYDFIETQPLESWEPGRLYAISGQLVSAFKHFRYGRNQWVTHFQVLSEGEIIKASIYNRRFLKEIHYKEGITVVGSLGKNQSIVARSVSAKPLSAVAGIKPVYSLKAGIKQHEIEKLIRKILDHTEIHTVVPETYQVKYRLLPRASAIRWCHFPSSKEALKQALRTLKYEEFLMYHMSVALNQQKRDVGVAKLGGDVQPYLQKLPYRLSKDQQQALGEIIDDLKHDKQMNRLLQGDVGSGKTIVAFLAMIYAMDAGYQSVLLAPTEVLLQQHLNTFRKYFPDIPAMTLSQNTTNRMEVLKACEEGEVPIVFGTHALFQDDVVFKKLGLVVIDEQHRFGVKQRQLLLRKGYKVDALMLSATPIPRTLANSLFFDLDVSSIETSHRPHKQIETHLIHENSLRSILPDLNQVLKRHEQIYVVCAAIEEGEREQVRNVQDIYKNLSTAFPQASLAMLHGKMSGSEKEAIMRAFAHHEFDILVATTVIEVGIDVHNANTMIIYNAEQFGLATLHQLRGRVGRGEKAGTCYVLTGSEQEESLKRLEMLVSSQDGFELSLYDMRSRGFGDVLGVRQSGIPHFILGDVLQDEAILKQAKIDAFEIVSHSEVRANHEIIEIVSQREYLKTT